jgi:curved DNA-binding protein CbpA
VAERNHYEVLGVAKSASADEIHAHYLEKLHQVHPDRNAGDEDKAHERTIEVVGAYRTLSDPEARKRYDFRAGNPFVMAAETAGVKLLKSQARKDAEARFSEGVHQVRLEDWPKAVECFKAALKAEPAYSAASYNLALLGALLGNANFSLDVLHRAIQADPKDQGLQRLRKSIHTTFLGS